MDSQVVTAIIAASVSVLTLIGTLLAQYFGRRATSNDTKQALQEQGRNLDRTLAEQRTRTLNERFSTAADKLGSDKPSAVQLAGVYALAGLADDWKENRQTCVDVLCGCLRVLHEADSGERADVRELNSYREVRRTIIQIIAAHLKDGAAVSWQGLNFDFRGAVFDGGSFRDAKFSGGTASFQDVQFSGGTVDFRDAEFSDGKVDFRGAEFSDGTVDFRGVKFSGGTVDFRGVKFSGGTVGFVFAVFSGGTVDFGGAEFAGGMVDFRGATVSDGLVGFGRAKFRDGTVSFRGAELSGGTVGFGGAEFAGSAVEFHLVRVSGSARIFASALFSGGTVSFDRAVLSGGTVDFVGAKFSGGIVDFRSVDDWSSPPLFRFQWDTPPSGVRLPKKANEPEA